MLITLSEGVPPAKQDSFGAGEESLPFYYFNNKKNKKGGEDSSESFGPHFLFLF